MSRLVMFVVMVGAGVLLLWMAQAAASGRLGRNPVAGIRLPVTMASDSAWLAARQAAKRPTQWAGWCAIAFAVPSVLPVPVPMVPQSGAHTKCIYLITVDVNNAARYACCVIQSFAEKDTERVWQRAHVHKFGPDLQRVANRKLLILDAAETITDLHVPPGNRFEQLQGNRKGQHSIRVNDQWRICFRWTSAGPIDVEITDYH